MAASVETTRDFTATAVSKKGLWIGRILSGLAVLFLVFDGVTKVMKLPAVMQASAQTQYPLGLSPLIGSVLLVCTAVSAFPRTSILGATPLPGDLGGAL